MTTRTPDEPIETRSAPQLEAAAEEAEGEAVTAREGGSALLAEGYEAHAAKCRSRAGR